MGWTLGRRTSSCPRYAPGAATCPALCAWCSPVREDPAGLVDVFKQLPVTLRPAKVEPGHLEVCIKLGSIPLVRPAEAIQEGGALRVLAHKGLDALGETVGHLRATGGGGGLRT